VHWPLVAKCTRFKIEEQINLETLKSYHNARLLSNIWGQLQKDWTFMYDYLYADNHTLFRSPCVCIPVIYWLSC